MPADDPRFVAPERWVRQLTLATMPPLDPRGGPPGEQHARHEAAIRQQLDAMWAHAFHAGTVWRAKMEPFRMVLPAEAVTPELAALFHEKLDCGAGVAMPTVDPRHVGDVMAAIDARDPAKRCRRAPDQLM